MHFRAVIIVVVVIIIIIRVATNIIPILLRAVSGKLGGIRLITQPVYAQCGFRNPRYRGVQLFYSPFRTRFRGGRGQLDVILRPGTALLRTRRFPAILTRPRARGGGGCIIGSDSIHRGVQRAGKKF